MTVKISGTLPSGAEGRYNGTYNVETGWTLGDSVVLVVECDVDSIEQKAEGEIIRKLKPTHIEDSPLPPFAELQAVRGSESSETRRAVVHAYPTIRVDRRPACPV